LWLCENHAKQTGAQLVDMEKNILTVNEEKNLFLHEIQSLEQSSN
jgi:hypothetical protein